MITALTIYWSRYMKFLQAFQERLRPLKVSLLVIIVFIAGFAVGNQHNLSLAQGDTVAPPGIEKSFEPFWQVYNLIQSNYLDRSTVQSDKLVDGAIKGMMDT